MFSTKIVSSHSRDFRSREEMKEHVRYVEKKITTTKLSQKVKWDFYLKLSSKFKD